MGTIFSQSVKTVGSKPSLSFSSNAGLRSNARVKLLAKPNLHPDVFAGATRGKPLGTGVRGRGYVVAGDSTFSPSTAKSVQAALAKTPKQWRSYVAYQNTIKVGGSLAWRFNNPGSLRGASSQLTRLPGGTGKFAVFTDMAAGRAAQRALYLDSYGHHPVSSAIHALTPPSENNTRKYLADLQRAGVRLNANVGSQIDALMKAIEANEGLISGVEIPR